MYCPLVRFPSFHEQIYSATETVCISMNSIYYTAASNIYRPYDIHIQCALKHKEANCARAHFSSVGYLRIKQQILHSILLCMYPVVAVV